MRERPQALKKPSRTILKQGQASARRKKQVGLARTLGQLSLHSVKKEEKKCIQANAERTVGVG